MALDQRQQMVDQRRRQVGCYWKQRTTGSYDDEIRRRRPEQRLAPMGGAAGKGFVKVRTRMNCSGRRPLPMRNLAVEFGIFKTPCVRYDMDFLRYDMDFLRYGSFLMFTYEHLGVACAKTKQTKTGTSRPSMHPWAAPPKKENAEHP